jgi:hypothetical protein
MNHTFTRQNSLTHESRVHQFQLSPLTLFLQVQFCLAPTGWRILANNNHRLCPAVRDTLQVAMRAACLCTRVTGLLVVRDAAVVG